jgi:cytochrome P450
MNPAPRSGRPNAAVLAAHNNTHQEEVLVMSVGESLVWPFTQPDVTSPPAEFSWLREQQPVIKVSTQTEPPVWLATRYEDIRAVISDPRFVPRMPVGALDLSGAFGSSLNQDEPGHTRLRKLIAREFTPRRASYFRPVVQRTVDKYMDAMISATRPADFMHHIGLRVPVEVMLELLGVPEAEREDFHVGATRLISADKGDMDGVAEAGLAIYTAVSGLVHAKREQPGSDLLTPLVKIRDTEPELISEEELVVMGMTMLVAGYSTTANAIGMGVVALIREGMLPKLQDDPTLIRTAAEEVLRYLPRMLGPVRVAKEDIQVGGVLIRAGETVVTPLSAANRDSEQFACPEGFDITRADNPHLAFGHGGHYCLGAHLARIELQEVFGALAARLPGLRLAGPVERLSWHTGFLGDDRLTDLLVTW